MNFGKRIFSLLVVFAILLGTGGFEPVFAYVPARVSTLDDEMRGECTRLRCTLRAAIREANPGDTIHFESSLSRGIIHLKEPLVIDKDLTIYGLTDGHINVSGDGNMRLFYINEGVNAEFVNVNFHDGLAWGEYGGAIYIDNATVSLEHVSVSGNMSGAIYMQSDDLINPESELTISNSVFRGNSGGVGGVIGGKGTVDVTDSYFVNNSTDTAGGAIHLSKGLLRVSNSTFNNNAGNMGGAIAFSHGVLTITNSTFFNNSATAFVGGAIRADEVSYSAISNCTFYGNDAVGSGGSLYVAGFSTLQLNNNIITSNASLNYCFISNAVNFTYHNNLVQTMQHDNQCGPAFIFADPLLGNLQDNGGETPTMLPDFLSPVIDAGDNATCEMGDQIGTNRPVDGDGDMISVCDIGAIEFNHQHQY